MRKSNLLESFLDLIEGGEGQGPVDGGARGGAVGHGAARWDKGRRGGVPPTCARAAALHRKAAARQASA